MKQAGGEVSELNSADVVGPIRRIAFEAAAEAITAREKWGPMHSAHEAWAVMKEEFDELWEHVKVNQQRRDVESMRKEAIQVAAMAMRFAHECCDEQGGRK